MKKKKLTKEEYEQILEEGYKKLWVEILKHIDVFKRLADK